MKTFKILCQRVVSDIIEVEAEDLTEALDKAKELPFQSNGEYVPGSDIYEPADGNWSE